ncbi:ribonuclease H2 subunit A [Pochonia chlamydosporia 170]|uniref:Ribonuclease n=1 Tax=Pochonia chlamydosporia 170 TaxID=1380566 RepID=A0A179FVN2_METCM|nr:ribonuclease H2 subunit A [Pochonia chlamydosporia 170]OAQ69181.1 ribonuclease H2 subunit A [Pochonia chlamydosporia 170]
MKDDDQSPPGTFIPPSIHREPLLSGSSFTHFSPVPPALLTPTDASDPASLPPLCLGVDEAGRGPVLGPMVYGIFYLPITLSDSLLRTTHHFDDSKVLTAAVRSSLMETLCTKDTDLHDQCGWATSSLSARDISANMLRPVAVYNLNAQAMDATIALIKGAFERGLNIQEIYVDTIGQPATYQAKLQRIFPTTKITVAKKADSLYPCVSAASVCAKVTRDAALEVLYEARREDDAATEGMEWGSGYPSDARCVNWLRKNMHPVFGWGPECRFSWGTAKDMLELKGGVKVDWPMEDDGDSMKVTDFFASGNDKEDELGGWYGTPVGLEAF